MPVRADSELAQVEAMGAEIADDCRGRLSLVEWTISISRRQEMGIGEQRSRKATAWRCELQVCGDRQKTPIFSSQKQARTALQVFSGH